MLEYEQMVDALEAQFEDIRVSREWSRRALDPDNEQHQKRVRLAVKEFKARPTPECFMCTEQASEDNPILPLHDQPWAQRDAWHVACRRCILKWVRVNPTCPMCKCRLG